MKSYLNGKVHASLAPSTPLERPLNLVSLTMVLGVRR